MNQYFNLEKIGNVYGSIKALSCDPASRENSIIFKSCRASLGELLQSASKFSDFSFNFWNFNTWDEKLINSSSTPENGKNSFVGGAPLGPISTFRKNSGFKHDPKHGGVE